MKQNITQAQYDQLDNKEKKIMNKWMKTNNYPYLMTIGQIIDFLDIIKIKKLEEDSWSIELKIKRMTSVYLLDGTLCDVLWEVVKHKLRT